MAGLIRRKPRVKSTLQSDAGLQQIDAWLAAYTAFNEERLRAWPAGPLLDAERATVAAHGAAIVSVMREQYRANRART